MDLENKHWDSADQDLTLWLNDDKHESSHPLSDILKSTYLVFWQKQKEQICKLCNQAFENFRTRQFEKIDINECIVFEETREYYSISEYTNNENERILRGILSNNQQIFNELYENELPKVVRLVQKDGGTVDLANDVFQDAMLILVKKVIHHKLELTCSVSTYLYSICRNLWMEQLRQNKKRMPLKDIFPYIDANILGIEIVKKPDRYEEVHAAIESLGDRNKKLLELFYFKKLGWEEIAKTLGYSSAASARNQKYNCLETIRGKMNVEVE